MFLPTSGVFLLAVTSPLLDWPFWAVMGRMLERLLVVFFAGVSVYLGYRLFVQVPTLRDSSGEVKFPSLNMTAKVTRVGPGVFFAIFGVAVLLSSYIHPISVESSPPKTESANAGGGAVEKFRGMNTTQSEQDELLRQRLIAHTVGSLNKLQGIISKKLTGEENSE